MTGYACPHGFDSQRGWLYPPRDSHHVRCDSPKRSARCLAFQRWWECPAMTPAALKYAPKKRTE